VHDQTQAEVLPSPTTESVDAPRTRREIVRIRRSSTETTASWPPLAHYVSVCDWRREHCGHSYGGGAFNWC